MLKQIQAGELLVVSRNRRNGIIIYKRFHADFAGPGAAVGGSLDRDCTGILPVGNLRLKQPASSRDLEEAYRIRRQWTMLTGRMTDTSSPEKRAKMILSQFENYFEPKVVASIPDEAFGLMVGIFPKTIAEVRQRH